MFTPYDYQGECLGQIHTAREDMGQQVALVVMASGTGKTVVLGNDLKEFLEGRPMPDSSASATKSTCLSRIRKPSKPSWGATLLNTASIMDSGKKGMRDFSSRRSEPWQIVEKFPRDAFAYIAIDESHHTPAATYRPTAEYFAPEFLLALTATPDREDLQDIREIFYGDEIYSLPLQGAGARILDPYRLSAHH